MYRTFLSLFLFLSLCLFSGCASTEETKEKAAQSKVPWSRPASWENQMPGFGGGGF